MSAKKEKNWQATLSNKHLKVPEKEGMQLIESSSPAKANPVHHPVCYLYMQSLPYRQKKMPQSRGPTFGKQVLLCL